MLKRVGTMLLVALMILSMSHTIVFADAGGDIEIDVYGVNAEYALGPNSIAYHEVKMAIFGGSITITNLSTSPSGIMVRIITNEGDIVSSTQTILPGTTGSYVIPPNLLGIGQNTYTISVYTGSTAGIYRYQIG